MTRHERTGTRSLVFSRWHRDELPDHCTAIDLDFIEYCPSCNSVLALLELTFSSSEVKATTVLERLAALADVPAFLIYARESAGRVVGGDVVPLYPRRGPPQRLDAAELADWFIAVHDEHRGSPCAGATRATAFWRRVWRKRRAQRDNDREEHS